MALTISSEPAVEPISLAEAKAHLRVDTSADDSLITSLIVAARKYFEERTRRSLITQSWKLTLDDFPTEFTLTRPPIQSVTSVKSVSYTHLTLPTN
mgnify:CR=1 FL=1